MKEAGKRLKLGSIPRQFSCGRLANQPMDLGLVFQRNPNHEFVLMTPEEPPSLVMWFSCVIVCSSPELHLLDRDLYPDIVSYH